MPNIFMYIFEYMYVYMCDLASLIRINEAKVLVEQKLYSQLKFVACRQTTFAGIIGIKLKF